MKAMTKEAIPPQARSSPWILLCVWGTQGYVTQNQVINAMYGQKCVCSENASWTFVSFRKQTTTKKSRVSWITDVTVVTCGHKAFVTLMLQVHVYPRGRGGWVRLSGQCLTTIGQLDIHLPFHWILGSGPAPLKSSPFKKRVGTVFLSLDWRGYHQLLTL